MRWIRKVGGVALIVAIVGGLPGALDAQHFDVLIRNGRVLDGTGNPAVRADVGIRGNRIVTMGNLERATADRIIVATGLHVVPGFIDIHSHADRALSGDAIEPRKAHNLVAQGITTVVGGPDGRNTSWPIAAEMDALRRHGLGVNFVPMVGHATVRAAVMGDDYERTATPDEVRRMQELVRVGMEDGAWGLGAAPEYRPGRFSNTEELIALAHVVADYDGFYFSHQRTQSPLPQWQYPSMVTGMPEIGIEGTKETIRIGRETGIRVVGSHMKTKGTDTWGWSASDVIQTDRARAEGVQVFFDHYPYETFGGSSHVMILPWAFAEPGTDYSGGRDDPKWRGAFPNFRENIRSNLADPVMGPALMGDMEYHVRKRGGADRIHIVEADFNPQMVGMSLQEVSEAWEMSPVDALFELALRHGTEDFPHAARFRSSAGSDWDVENYMRQPYTATSTDGVISGNVRPGQHPRSYGAFVRKISHYARDLNVISIPFAVRSNTSLPAMIIGLQDRGLVREGYFADLVIFDYDRLDDRATIMEPDLYPEGIDFVLVNGELVVDDGRLTGALPGTVIDRNAARATMENGAP